MPTNFRITVTHEEKEYEVNVTRVSSGVTANVYQATIVTPEEIMNKYPPVTYNVLNNDLVYKDTLDKIYQGFAEIQKEEIKKYLDSNGIDL